MDHRLLVSSLLSLVMSLAALSACGHGSDDISNETITTKANEDSVTCDSVRLMYMGQASIRITTADGHVIYIDPYAGKSDWYTPSADLILITHEHFDHTQLQLIRNRRDTCRIIRAKDAICDGKHMTFRLGYVTVEAVEAGYNRYHDPKECVGYELTFPKGHKVYVTGDTSITPQMSSMGSMHIDYAFLCTDGYFNMNVEEAERAAAMIKARHVIPYHNDVHNRPPYFDEQSAREFEANGKMLVLPGETIAIE